MILRTTYIGTLDGVSGIWCGFKPEGAIIIQEIEVLYADEGYKLQRISDQEILDYVVLEDGDTEENYIEIESPEDNKTNTGE